MLSLLEVLKIWLNAEHGTRVLHPDQKRPSVAVKKRGNGLGDTFSKQLLDLFLSLPGLQLLQFRRQRAVGVMKRGFELDLVALA